MAEQKYKKELQAFSEKIKEYQKICCAMWGTREHDRDTEEFMKLRKAEEKFREELVYEWGISEHVYRKLGIETIGEMMGRQFSIFDQALDQELFNNPIKDNALSMAVQSSIKALGKIQSVDIKELDLKDEKFHPRIKSGRCLGLYSNGHYPEAVENSFKIVRDRLRELTGYERGSDAFGKGKLYVRGASASHIDEDFQNGVKFLTMALDNFRNEKAHFSDGSISDSNRAKAYIGLSNLLMNLFDEAEIKNDKK